MALTSSTLGCVTGAARLNYGTPTAVLAHMAMDEDVQTTVYTRLKSRLKYELCDVTRNHTHAIHVSCIPTL